MTLVATTNETISNGKVVIGIETFGVAVGRLSTLDLCSDFSWSCPVLVNTSMAIDTQVLLPSRSKTFTESPIIFTVHILSAAVLAGCTQLEASPHVNL